MPLLPVRRIDVMSAVPEMRPHSHASRETDILALALADATT